MTDLAHQALVGQSVRLGKHPKREDPRTLQLVKYLEPAALPPPPPLISNIPLTEHLLETSDWGMMGNDRLGDCTCAALGHAEQVWEAIGAAKKFSPSEHAVETLYYRTGTQDDGRVMLDVLNYVQKRTLFRHKLIAFAEVNREQTLVETAIELFGGVYIGLGLPVSAQHQTTWDVVDGPDGAFASWGGHAVWLPDYDSNGPICITWGRPLQMTWAFFAKYCDEAYALLARDWIHGGKSPQGFNLAALQADLAAITN